MPWCSPTERRAAPEDRWFEQLGIHIADILHEVGVPYCKGGVMAKNPQWRGSLDVWRTRVGDWIQRSQPQDLLSVDIFFDMLGVHGDWPCATTSGATPSMPPRGGQTLPSCWPRPPVRVSRGLTFFAGSEPTRAGSI